MNSPASVSVVVTSIAAPNAVLKSLAAGCEKNGHSFFVIGDVPSPANFHIEGCQFFGLADQMKLDLETAKIVPERHYARKNIGYLLAMREGAEVLVETDDDNFPLDAFWDARVRRRPAAYNAGSGWVNVYRYFSQSQIWPRGLPLDAIHNDRSHWEELSTADCDCPIQQGLADENPDVDAIYRLTYPLPLSFRKDRQVALGKNSWCPFNSQNTTWWREAFPLLYLPAYCSFRMTDIWRSFVAQRIAWEMGWSILFHEPTVYQERNEHNLMRDFEDEVPGYLHNRTIADTLNSLTLKPGAENIPSNLLCCYEELVRKKIFVEKELELVHAWLNDVKASG